MTFEGADRGSMSMTEGEYDAIATQCDLLLRARETSLERIAVPVLHVINEHAGWMSQYASVLHANRAGQPLPPRSLATDARTVARVTRALWRSLKHPVPTFGARAPEQGVDVLIVSHLADPLRVGQSGDFYFGDLQELLDERGITSSLVWVDHLRSRDARLACTEQLVDSRRMLLPNSVSPATEARIWRRCLTAAAVLREEASALSRGMYQPGRWRSVHRGLTAPPDLLHGSLAALASRHVLYETTAANLRLHESLASYCRILRPRIVITTHEGDACERVIWHAARSANALTLCVGYQHTRMLARAHAIKRPVRVRDIPCDPDVILTLGELSHSELSKCPELSSVRLITYGSHRRVSALQPTPFERRPRACVVLPNADEIESVLLFEFALDCARASPDVTFILRPHPSADISFLRSRHASLRDLPANVRLSTETLEQECQAAKYCLHRGSSAAMHAVLYGVKPFYLARARELPFDPLYALGEWREAISSVEEFLNRAILADAAYDAGAAARAQQLCDRSVSMVRPEAVGELLALAFPASRGRRAAG